MTHVNLIQRRRCSCCAGEPSDVAILAALAVIVFPILVRPAILLWAIPLGCVTAALAAPLVALAAALERGRIK